MVVSKRVVILALTAVLTGMTVSALTLEVSNGAFERFEHTASTVLTSAQAQDLAGKTLKEVGRQGTQPVPWVLDDSGEDIVLTWSMPGITPPGTVRRFVAETGSPATPAAGDLTVTETDADIVVRNAYLDVTHPKTGGGGFPSQIGFPLSGTQDPDLHFLDRLYRREGDGAYRGQYMAEHDPEASARVAFESPVRVVIESRTRYVRGGSPAPGNPRAVYRYVYTPFSPVVKVTATVTRDDDEPWNELHFLHLTRNDYHYTSFITGAPPEETPMQAPGTPSRSLNGSAWGVMATETNAAGVGGGPVTCWDASDEFYYYVVRSRGSWASRQKRFAGTLYLGPAPADLSWYSRWLNPARQPDVTLIEDTISDAAQTDAEEPIEGVHTLRNDALTLAFGGPENGFACVGIQNRLVDDERFVYPRAEAPGLWTLTFRTPRRGDLDIEDAPPYREAEVSNRDEAELSATRTSVDNGTQLTFSWTGLDLPEEPDCLDVTASVLLRPGTGSSEWRIEIDNRSETFGLWDVTYPLLTTVSPKGTADVMQPRGNWGGTLVKNSRAALGIPYPSAACPVQFMAFNRGQAGLYIAAHDGGARAKTLRISTDQDASFETQAEDMGVPGAEVAAPFPFVIAAYRGDWWEAARIYRAWAVRQTWTRKGWIADREDIPDHMKDIGMWWLGGGQPDAVLAMMERADDACPLPIGLHWYNWHEIPFDHSYPNYFPTKPGFSEVVRTLTGRGQVIMPYINGRLWDRDIPSFPERGIRGACKQPDGTVYTEIYGSKRRLSPMCPTTQLWQDTVVDICHRLMHDCGVNAIYLDQIGAARPRLCFDPEHGHPLGGGRHWVDGYREMLDRIKADAVEMNVGLTTENTAEPYMDNIDAYLAWVQRNDTDIPLLPAVYSGYTLYFTSPQDARDTVEAFAMAQGRDFLWGCQLGWNHDWLLRPEHSEKLAFQLTLCKLHLAGRAFMVEGQLLDEIRPTQPLPTLTAIWNRRSRHSASLPVVQGTLWKDRSQRLAVFLVNYDKAPHAIHYEVEPGRYLDDASGPWLISRLTESGLAPWTRAAGPVIRRGDLMAGREARALVIEQLPSSAPARARRAAAGADPVLATCAREFLFTEKATAEGLALTPPEPMRRVVKGEPLTLSLGVASTTSDRALELQWPDGDAQRISLNKGEQRTVKRMVWPGSGDAGYERLTLGVRLGGESFDYPIQVAYVPALEVRSGCPTAVRSGESFVLPLTATNHSRTTRQAHVRLDTPSDWRVEPAPTCDLGTLSPGASRSVLLKCRVPAANVDARTTVRVQLIREAAAHDVMVLRSRPRAGAVRFPRPPAIDGRLDDWQGIEGFHLGPEGPSSIKIEDSYGGRGDCSAKIRVGWDPEHLYLAAEVTDDQLVQEENGFQLWRGDCLQLAFRDGPPNPESGYDGTEYELGLTLAPDGPLVFQWMPGEEPLDTTDLAVVRRQNVTVYEAAVPWQALGIENMRTGRRVAWSMTVNDNDGKGFRGWLEWTPGVCGGKDSSAFGWLEALSATALTEQEDDR